MVNTKQPHSSRNVFQQQSQPSARPRPQGGVRQDKRAFLRARTASHQPASLKNDMRAQAIATENIRSRNRNEQKRKTIQLTLWVKPIVKTELEQIAEQEGLSISATGSAVLEKALQEHIDMQYGALLEPVIKKCIAKEIQGMSTRLAWLLVRVAFDVGQIRGLSTNILGRQPGMNQDILTTILKESGKAAKMNITRRTPQLTELMEVLNKWLSEKGKEEKIGE
jgi:hypothetical protein